MRALVGALLLFASLAPSSCGWTGPSVSCPGQTPKSAWPEVARPEADQASQLPTTEERRRGVLALRVSGIRLAKQSLSEGPDDQRVWVTLSFSATQSLSQALGVARSAGLRAHTIRHGIRIRDNYFTGELPVLDEQSSPRNQRDIESDFAELLALLEKDAADLVRGFPEDDAARSVLSDIRMRRSSFRQHGLPVVGLRTSGTLGQARKLAGRRPDTIVGAAPVACGPLDVILPEDSIVVRPD